METALQNAEKDRLKICRGPSCLIPVSVKGGYRTRGFPELSESAERESIGSCHGLGKQRIGYRDRYRSGRLPDPRSRA
jgi:hypothetical protein